MVNENDIRGMLHNMRASQRELGKRMMSEATGGIDPQEFAEEKQLFTQAVDGLAHFGNFQRYDNNVLFQGTVGTGQALKWYFSLVDGLTVSAEMFSLDDTNYATVEKLKAYYDIWKDKWLAKLNGAEAPQNPQQAPQQQA
jgi:hypothetical protein